MIRDRAEIGISPSVSFRCTHTIIKTLSAFILRGGQVHFQPLFQSASSQVSKKPNVAWPASRELCRALWVPTTRVRPPCPSRPGCTADPLPLCPSWMQILTNRLHTHLALIDHFQETHPGLVLSSFAQFYLFLNGIATSGLSSKPPMGTDSGIWAFHCTGYSVYAPRGNSVRWPLAPASLALILALLPTRCVISGKLLSLAVLCFLTCKMRIIIVFIQLWRQCVCKCCKVDWTGLSI